MFFVYLIKSESFPEQTYTGSTTNVENRLLEHNSGKSSHTAKYGPWKLHAYFVFPAKDLALKFEKYPKTHSGRAFAAKHFWGN